MCDVEDFEWVQPYYSVAGAMFNCLKDAEIVRDKLFPNHPIIQLLPAKD